MSINDLTRKAQEIQELKRLQEELDAEITAVEDEIKAAMGEQEQITAGAYRITWKPVTSSRLDTAALKRELPEIAARFMKSCTIRRFTIA